MISLELDVLYSKNKNIKIFFFYNQTNILWYGKNGVCERHQWKMEVWSQILDIIIMGSNRKRNSFGLYWFKSWGSLDNKFKTQSNLSALDSIEKSELLGI